MKFVHLSKLETRLNYSETKLVFLFHLQRSKFTAKNRQGSTRSGRKYLTLFVAFWQTDLSPIFLIYRFFRCSLTMTCIFGSTSFNHQQKSSYCSIQLKNVEDFCHRLCFFLFFLFLFSTQNQVPQLIVGLGRVIPLLKIVSLVTQTTFKKKQFFLRLEKNWFGVFAFRLISSE